MQADLVGERSGAQGNECSADDGSDEEARAFAGEGAEVLNAEGEDRREHDGVEDADEEEGIHREVAVGEDGDDDEGEGTDGRSAEDGAGAYALQDGRAEEAADHGAAPVDHEEFGGDGLGECTDLGEAQVVDEEAADGDFGADVGEDADGTGDEPGMVPDAVGLGEGLGEGSGAEVLGEIRHAGLRLELDESERDGEEEQHERDADVG